MINIILVALILSTSPSLIAGVAIDYTGYIVDSYCWNKPAIGSFPPHTAPPAGCIDLTKSPELHTMECIRDVTVCLNSMVMLSQDTTTNIYSKKYSFDAASTLSLQQLICDQKGTVKDSSKLLSSTSCNPGAPDLSISNGGHALSKIHVVGEATSAGVISNAIFNIDGTPSVMYPMTTSPAFKLDGQKNFPKCPTKSGGGGSGGGGDTNSFSSPDGHWTAKIMALTETSISWKVTHDCKDAGDTGWFGFGISKDGTMDSSSAGSEIYTCTSSSSSSASAGKALASQYWVTAKSMPTNGKELTASTCTWAMGKGTMTFTRDFKANNNKERTIEKIGATNFLWAYGTSKTIGYHGGNKGSISFDVSTGGSSGSTIPVPALVAIHAIAMLLGWGLLLPLGAMFARCCKKDIKDLSTKGPFWFVMHKRLQISGWLLQLIGFICIAIYKGEQQFVGNGQLHMWLGLVVVILGTLNPVVAMLRPHPTNDDGEKTTNRKIWEIIHKYLIGWNAVIFGLVNCIVATLMLHSTAYTFDPWLGTLAAVFLGALSGGSLIVFLLWHVRSCKAKTSLVNLKNVSFEKDRQQQQSITTIDNQNGGNN